MNLAPATLLDSRLTRLRASFEPAGCDALVVTHPPNIFYLTNFTGSAGVAVVTQVSLHLILDFRYLTLAEDLLASGSGPSGARLERVTSGYDQATATTVAATGVRRVGIESAHLTVSRYAWLNARFAGGATLVPACGLVERLRECKDAHEISVMRRAARLLSDIAVVAIDNVKAGDRERDIAACIDSSMRRAGFQRPAFDTIVGSGPNGALPHAAAGDRVTGRGDLVVLDFGGVCDGYCADLSRTVSLGAAGAEARRVHGAVRAAQAAAIATVRPGVAASEIDRAARQVLEAEGLGDAFGHGTGHGLGIEVHEDPRIAPARDDEAGSPGRASGATVVRAGMVFTIEPGAYIPGWGGVRIEDDVLVTDAGCEILTRVPAGLVER